MNIFEEQINFLERIKNSSSFVSENSRDEFLLKKYSHFIVQTNNKPFITSHGEIHYGKLKLSNLGELELEKLKNK